MSDDLISRFIETTEQQPIKVAIVGDLLLDAWHEVSRVSAAREQDGVLTLLSPGEPVWTLGGAGNAARQFENLNVEVKLFTMADDRAVVQAIENEHPGFWQAEGNDPVMLDTGCVPVKHRYLSGDRLLVRIDDEQPVSEDELGWLRRTLVERLLGWLPSVDGLLISDYGKGCLDVPSLREILHAAKRFEIPTVVDPHLSRAADAYGGWGIFKPNELYDLRRGLPDDCRGHVMTRGGRPPTGNDSTVGRFTCPPWPAVGIVSAVGAGDCFAAHLLAAWVRGFAMPDAATVADVAARRYVGQRRTDPVALGAMMGSPTPSR